MKESEIIQQNLRDAMAFIPKSIECRMAHLAEAAELFLPDAMTPPFEISGVLGDIGDKFLDLVLDAETSAAECLVCHKKEVERAIRAESEDMAVFFSVRLFQKMQALGLSLLPQKESSDNDGIKHKVAYVSNHLSDDAFRRYTLCDRTAIGVHAESFRAAAEGVSDGDVSFCILPFENSVGERILSAYSLMDQLDLSVIGVIDVPDGDSTSRFAVLASTPTALLPKENIITCRVIPSKRLSIGSILRAVDLLGMTVLRYDSDRRLASGSSAFILSLSCSSEMPPEAFLTYAYAFTASCTLYGIYGNL